MNNKSLLSFFGDLEDKRSHINKLHSLDSILLIAVASVVCGAQTWKQMEEFAHSKRAFLEKFVDFPNGIPSDDTINRAISALDNKHFERCFANFFRSLTALSEPSSGQVIAIDGKTARGAKWNGEKSFVHMVNAWATEFNMVMGQVKVDDKSNEITAIPELLEMLFIEGDIVTIDAMGTQTAIAEKIREKGADYILAVKDNQKELHSQVKDEFRFANRSVVSTENVDFGHGRIETRKCKVIADFQFVKNESNKWKDLKCVVEVECVREFKNSDKPKEKAVRYFISSLGEIEPAKILDYTRAHWGVENKLHWVLDVQFGEDYSRKRYLNAAENYSIIMKVALNMLKNDTKTKQGIQGKRLKAAWNDNYLMELLGVKV
jgi:predicted transposase YbfD/YdcC